MRTWIAAILLSVIGSAISHAQEPIAMKIKAPELREVTEWINSKPLKLKELEGKVVVVHFWAFG